MSDFLRQMAAASAARAETLQSGFPASQLDRPVRPLVLDRFDLIAEIKRLSPAAGALAPADEDRASRARQYTEGGAAAISVLTEPSRFGGALEHLQDVAAAADVPVMRKDFLVDVRQVEEARAAGASGVLLILALLDDAALRGMLDCAFELSMFVLLECFDENEVKRASRLVEHGSMAAHASQGRLLVGVNSRDLRTLGLDAGRLRSLAPLLPAAAVTVAESGLSEASDAAQAAGLGYRMALVGTALMRADDPARLIRGMLRAGRERLS
ncbi:MAG TPA: indole-3-glycerol-phosphate synthase [Woeseiaceae bacterium]|nr:indole-3-glycerol-phosphate synthase [Woeseiaceae bacterium]